MRLTCVMNGFEAEENKTALPDWRTNFENNQIFKSNDGPSWVEEGYAGWNVNASVSVRDSGDKVRLHHSFTQRSKIFFRLQKISCNYQQGNFAKVIEVEFNIYTIKEINADLLDCSENKVSIEIEVLAFIFPSYCSMYLLE